MWLALVLIAISTAALPLDDVAKNPPSRTLDFHETNPTETPYGVLEEGDILMPPTQQDRQGAIEMLMWDNRQYYYTFSPEAEYGRQKIETGIQFWRDNTCITMTEVPASSQLPKVKFIADSGCYSSVGCFAKYLRSKVQTASLPKACLGHGTITHEIGHSLGLYHQQSRADRDSYVRILFQNIRTGMEHNFFMATDSRNFSVPYDYGSVMHYGSKFFSKNGQYTIETLDPTKQSLIGQRRGPSFRDVAVVNRMYRCEELCARPPQCLNGGYVSADCTCHCPPNTSGVSCDRVTGSYYSEPGCGGVITIPGVLNSTDITECTWWVRPPQGKRARVTFGRFSVTDRQGDACPGDFLEVRADGVGSESRWYCGRELQGAVLTSGGVEGDMVLHLAAPDNTPAANAFSAQVDFI